MSNDVYTALALLADIDRDHLHAFHDPQNPRHNEAVKSYSELAEWCSSELSKRRGACDYHTGKGAPAPPALKETRPGFARLKPP